MAFQIPTEADLRKVCATAHTPIVFVAMGDDGKERTYKTRLIGDCEDTPKGIAALAGAQTKPLTSLVRAEKSKYAGGKLVAGKERGITSQELEQWLLRYVEATAEGQPVTVDAGGNITAPPTPPAPVPEPEPEPEPEKKGRRKGHDRGGVDPSLIPVAAPATANGEAGNG